MLDDILGAYTDPIFLYFPILATVVSVVSFVAFATPLTWLWIADPGWARPYRIQRPRHKAIRKHLVPAIQSWLLNNLVMTGLVVLAWPLIYPICRVHAGELPAWWVMVLQFVAFVALDDFLYYWMHRGLHSDLLFKRVHLQHHTISTPFAWMGHYMTPVEFVLTGSLALIGPMLFGSHVVVLWAWIAWRQWEAAEGHCGYAFPLSPSKLFWPLYDGVEYHDFHHSKTRGNYAGFFGYLDRLFGRYAKGYKAHLGGKRGGKQPDEPWRRE